MYSHVYVVSCIPNHIGLYIYIYESHPHPMGCGVFQLFYMVSRDRTASGSSPSAANPSAAAFSMAVRTTLGPPHPPDGAAHVLCATSLARTRAAASPAAPSPSPPARSLCRASPSPLVDPPRRPLHRRHLLLPSTTTRSPQSLSNLTSPSPRR
jgi:hypothetical protein